ncbi:hypothetical protein AYO41_01460 [Verrucomicrobia bacterium SCGC AG-212-E04]|nr:hypothetical protein AYO41_01460 [Verrucomicrobia bacterium SCGC AG-212-E04]
MRVSFATLLLGAAWLASAPSADAQDSGWTRLRAERRPAARRVVFEQQAWTADGGEREAAVDVVRFESRDAVLRVVDQGAAGEQDLAGAMSDAGALAGINGGYFHPDRQPLGLVVSGGETIHAEERARLLSGVLLVFTNGSMKLQRVSEPRAKADVREALQAGPFLVDAGKAVAGLENSRAARRSVLATDGAGRWAILTINRVTLADAAALLATPGVLGDGIQIQRALNLDGGSSTGLWVKGEGGAAPRYTPEFGTVRNFVGVFPR